MIRGTNHWHTVKGPAEDKIASIRQLSTRKDLPGIQLLAYGDYPEARREYQHRILNEDKHDE